MIIAYGTYLAVYGDELWMFLVTAVAFYLAGYG
jgi:hypothetical protein